MLSCQFILLLLLELVLVVTVVVPFCLRATDFVKVAEAFGVKGLRINTNDEIDSVLDEVFSYNGPVLVDCRISKDSNVLPMIPPGGAHTDIIEEFN